MTKCVHDLKHSIIFQTTFYVNMARILRFKPFSWKYAFLVFFLMCLVFFISLSGNHHYWPGLEKSMLQYYGGILKDLRMSKDWIILNQHCWNDLIDFPILYRFKVFVLSVIKWLRIQRNSKLKSIQYLTSS